MCDTTAKIIIDSRELDFGGLETLSGPEYVLCGSPRRWRKVWVVGLAVDSDGAACGGVRLFRTESDARAFLTRRENPESWEAVVVR